MAESDHRIKYRKEVTERQEDWQRSVNKRAPGESKAQLLKQIDAAEKLLEAIKTLRPTRRRVIVPSIERTTLPLGCWLVRMGATLTESLWISNRASWSPAAAP
jgi:hypothetical protein